MATGGGKWQWKKINYDQRHDEYGYLEGTSKEEENPDDPWLLFAHLHRFRLPISKSQERLAIARTSQTAHESTKAIHPSIHRSVNSHPASPRRRRQPTGHYESGIMTKGHQGRPSCLLCQASPIPLQNRYHFNHCGPISVVNIARRQNNM
uniref:Uncharacterized protein n=1 Tax=Panagrellus redivivus TaxID=6233 RepID=A0A7E4W7U8_PANRE